MKRALIIVDMQNDFMPGGALPVPQADEIVPVINGLIPGFELVVAARDWHPLNHGSFASSHPGKGAGDVIQLNGLEQILWPDHCIQNSKGAELVNDLGTNSIDVVFEKGKDPDIDSYSALYDNGHRQSTGLAEFLRNEQVSHAFIVGVATDYCVMFTALDAVADGFETTVIIDACRGVNIQPDDVETAIETMKNHNVSIVTSANL